VAREFDDELGQNMATDSPLRRDRPSPPRDSVMEYSANLPKT